MDWMSILAGVGVLVVVLAAWRVIMIVFNWLMKVMGGGEWK